MVRITESHAQKDEVCMNNRYDIHPAIDWLFTQREVKWIIVSLLSFSHSSFTVCKKNNLSIVSFIILLCFSLGTCLVCNSISTLDTTYNDPVVILYDLIPVAVSHLQQMTLGFLFWESNSESCNRWREHKQWREIMTR